MQRTQLFGNFAVCNATRSLVLVSCEILVDRRLPFRFFESQTIGGAALVLAVSTLTLYHDATEPVSLRKA